MENNKQLSTELFCKELENKVSSVFNEEQIRSVMDATKYFGINNTVNGKEFWEKVILDAPKDYPTVSAKFFQSLTELKSRLGRLFDDTIEFQKLEIEVKQLELEIEEMEEGFSGLEGRERKKAELTIELKKQDLLKKRVRCAFSKDNLLNLQKEINDFKELCDKYKATGEVKPFEVARLEEMDKKKKLLFLAHVQGTKRDLSIPELAFFLGEDGSLRPPEGIEEDLIRLGRPDLAQLVQHNRTIVDEARRLRDSGQVPQLEEPIKIINN